MNNAFQPRGSWVALVTPFDEDDQVDTDALRQLIDRHCAQGTAGIVVAGTTGESAALNDGDYQRLLATAMEASDGRLPVMAGVGSPATHKAVKLAELAARHRVDAMLCVTPYYLKTTQQGLIAHYRALAETVDLPMVLYNVPGRTAVDLQPETAAQLATLDTVVGIKEAVADSERIRQLAQLCPQEFSILSGDDASCLDTLRAGGVGVVSVTANLLPAAMARLCCLHADDEPARAQRLQQQLAPLHAMTMEEPNPMPVKSALHRLGLLGPGIRMPLLPATDKLVDRMIELVESQFATDRI